MIKRKKREDDDDGFAQWGGYMEAKKTKLEEQYSDEAANMFRKTDLFAGISIFVNGYTNPTSSELKCLMMTHGGIYHHYKRSHTNFTIANNLPDVKIKAIKTEKIVRPEWIVDSIQANRVLDYSKYLLHTNQKVSQPKLQFTRTEQKKQKPSPLAKEENQELVNIMLELDVLNKQMNESLQAEQPAPVINLISSSESSTMPGDALDSLLPKPPPSPDLFEMEEELDSDIPCHQPEQEKPLSPATEDKENDEETVPGTPPTPLPAKKRLNRSQTGSTSVRRPTKMAKTATDPNFLTEFFQNSRLHHIATLGAGFKQHITELREKSKGKFPKRESLKKIFQNTRTVDTGNSGKTIMHIDMDCFFVSVGLRKYPHLKGQPVAVTHSKGAEGGVVTNRPGMDRQQEIALYNKRLANKLQTNIESGTESRMQHIDDNNSLAEIASCSYEARAKGVKNGMFVGTALKLCPNLKTIPYDFDGYKEVAYHLYDTIAEYTLDIEAVSCDEMFVDLTDILADIGIPCDAFVSLVRNEVRDKTQCSCSAGVGSNRLQARLATRKAKPDGQFYLRPEEVADYMRDIPLTDLPGVGRSTGHRLRQLKWETCEDLQRIPLGVLQREFGRKFGDTLFQFSRGIEDRPLVFGQIRKSVSVEVNYGIRFTEQHEVETFLRQLCTEVHKRLTEIRQQGKTITLKVMVRAKEAPVETAKFMGHGFCDTVNKSTALTNFTGDLEVITYNVLSLMKQMALPPAELRGIGIHISKFPVANDGKSNSSAGNVLRRMFQKVEERKKEVIAPPVDLDKSFAESLRRVAESAADMTLPEDVLVEALTPEHDKSIRPWSPGLSPVTKTPNKQRTPTKNAQNSLKLVRSPVSRLSIDPVPSTSKATIVAPAKKKRGRPRKIDQVKKNTTNLFQTLLAQKQPEPDDQDDLEGLDLQVLAELPDDIREEVIRDHKRQRRLEQQQQQIKEKQEKAAATKAPKKKIQVDTEFLEALPPALRQQVEQQINKERDKFLVTENSPAKAGTSKIVEAPTPKVDELEKDESADTPQVSADNVFLQSDWRKQIKLWIESAEKPETYDVEMLAKNAQELVATRNIELLYVAFKMLYRLISERNICDWHQAYTKITNHAQSEMFDMYESKLRVQRRFKCLNES